MADEEYCKFLESLKTNDILKLAKESKEYALLNGLIFEQINEGNTISSIIPHTLFPTPFSAAVMQKAKFLQPAINILVYVMSLDTKFIESSLLGAEKNDSFTAGLLNVLRSVSSHQYPQIATAAILRTDYMVDNSMQKDSKSNELCLLKQIEINTISVAYGAHSSCISTLHRNTFYNIMQNNSNKKMKEYVTKYIASIPSNDTLAGIASCIRKCWIMYDANRHILDEMPAIVFAVQHNEKNKFDQLKIYYLLREVFLYEETRGMPPILMLTLEEMADQLELDKETGILTFLSADKTLKYEIGVIYFRGCYGPTDFSKEKIWTMRKTVEISKAIKIPNISTHLIGSKKFQQIIANDRSLVDHYLKKAIKLFPDISNVSVDDIVSTFATFYSLDPKEVDVVEVTRLVKKNVNNYVLKPQREGGGNNLYGKEMLGTINEKLKNGSLSDYIVMSLVHPKAYSNYRIADNTDKPVHFKSIAELGIFGHFIVDHSDNSIINKVDGHIVRTKATQIKDGGVSSGNAVLDSPILL